MVLKWGIAQILPRSGHVSFLDPDREDIKRAYCQKCEDIAGQFNKLVPRIVNGVLDNKFKLCSYCGEVYPIFDVKFEPEYEPKGYISDNPFDTGAKVAVKDAKRRSRKLYKNKPLPNEDVEIPKFAGKKDEFLEEKLKEGAIVHSIDDSWDYDEV